jgi:hypothetical protein
LALWGSRCSLAPELEIILQANKSTTSFKCYTAVLPNTNSSFQGTEKLQVIVHLMYDIIPGDVSKDFNSVGITSIYHLNILLLQS